MRDITESKPPDWIGAIRSGPPWIQAEGADGQIVRLFPNDAQIRQIHGVLHEYLMAMAPTIAEVPAPVEVEPVAEWPKYFEEKYTNPDTESDYHVFIDENHGFAQLHRDREWETYNRNAAWFSKKPRVLQLTPAEFAALGLPPIPLPTE